MKVRAIDFVVTYVSDLDGMKAFYRETLGIDEEALFESEDIVELDTDPVALSLFESEEATTGTAIALAVEDVEAAVEELREQGVTIIGQPVETPVCTMATVTDPDGNPIIIHRRHDGTAG